MKISIIILCTCIELFFARAAAAQFITNCFTVPEIPRENMPFTLRTQGMFPSSHWEIYQGWLFYPEYCPSYQISGNEISAKLYSWMAHDIGTHALIPWEQDIIIYGLPRGGYHVSATLQALDGSGYLWPIRIPFIVGPPTSFSSQAISNTNFQLGWNGDTSLVFTIQYSTQLEANIWKTIPTFSNINGSSGRMEYQEPLSNGPPKMFRILSTVK